MSATGSSASSATSGSRTSVDRSHPEGRPVVCRLRPGVVVRGRGEWEVRPLAAQEVDRVGAVLGLARLDQRDGFYLVAWERGTPVGHAYLALTDPPELQDVEVRQRYRGRGVASSLTAAVEAQALARGLDRLRVTVSVNNPAAQALYRKLGYADVGLPPRHVRGTILIRTGPLEIDDTLLTWEKRLVS
jgi:ribosomal protein S18 acetylase RimI-like enzyme